MHPVDPERTSFLSRLPSVCIYIPETPWGCCLFPSVLTSLVVVFLNNRITGDRNIRQSIKIEILAGMLSSGRKFDARRVRVTTGEATLLHPCPPSALLLPNPDPSDWIPMWNVQRREPLKFSMKSTTATRLHSHAPCLILFLFIDKLNLSDFVAWQLCTVK